MNARPTEVKQCSTCGTQFECGARSDSCWCQQLPSLAPGQLNREVDCYCPSCLAELARAADAIEQSGPNGAEG